MFEPILEPQETEGELNLSGVLVEKITYVPLSRLRSSFRQAILSFFSLELNQFTLNNPELSPRDQETLLRFQQFVSHKV